MIDVNTELRRFAGRLAIGMMVIYLMIVCMVDVAGLWSGRGLALLLPLPVFVPSTVLAVRLHLTTDPDRSRILWRWAFGLGVLGTVMWVGVLVALNR